MSKEMEDLGRAIRAMGFGGLTQEQKEDIRFRLLMGESMQAVAALYQVTVARVYEVKNWVR